MTENRSLVAEAIPNFGAQLLSECALERLLSEAIKPDAPNGTAIALAVALALCPDLTDESRSTIDVLLDTLVARSPSDAFDTLFRIHLAAMDHLAEDHALSLPVFAPAWLKRIIPLLPAADLPICTGRLLNHLQADGLAPLRPALRALLDRTEQHYPDEIRRLKSALDADDRSPNALSGMLHQLYPDDTRSVILAAHPKLGGPDDPKLLDDIIVETALQSDAPLLLQHIAGCIAILKHHSCIHDSTTVIQQLITSIGTTSPSAAMNALYALRHTYFRLDRVDVDPVDRERVMFPLIAPLIDRLPSDDLLVHTARVIEDLIGAAEIGRSPTDISNQIDAARRLLARVEQLHAGESHRLRVHLQSKWQNDDLWTTVFADLPATPAPPTAQGARRSLPKHRAGD